MNALVIYDSKFGNTARIAEKVSDVLGAQAVSVLQAQPESVAGLDLLVGRYGWGADDVPPTRQGTCIAEVGGASLVITLSPEMPSAPKGWQVQAHIPPRPRFELDTPTRKVIAVGPEGGRERSEGELLQQRWCWAVCR